MARARGILREVRYALNEVRDNSFDGLLRPRNQTYLVQLLTEMATFALLAIAWLAHVPPAAIVAGVTFFITGVAVGLFNRLREQAKLDVAVLDYGLAAIRLLTLPIYSRLAAVGGVVVQGLSNVQYGSDGLLTVFDLARNPAGILVAAGFGLAPAMLFNALGDSSVRFSRNISSTQGAAVPTPSGEDGAAAA